MWLKKIVKTEKRGGYKSFGSIDMANIEIEDVIALFESSNVLFVKTVPSCVVERNFDLF